jgi:non-specific serine/threonine protein kinase
LSDWRNPQNERAYVKFQEQSAQIVFHFLKSRWRGLNSFLCLFLDPWWNPFAEKQGIGRASYIGQLNKVNVVRFSKIPSRKNHSVTENKLLSDALLDETTSALKLKKI